MEPQTSAPDKDLIAGVLNQAAYDLRRFRCARTRVEQELYFDAHTWITANDFSWPFSFLNVCQSLGLVPEMVREEVLADASLGTVDYWLTRAGRISRAFRASMVRVFTRGDNAVSTANAWATPAFQAQ